MSNSSPSQLMNLDEHARREAWEQLAAICEAFYHHTAELPVTPILDKVVIENHARKFDFNSPLAIDEALRHVEEGLKSFAVHTSHPKYFGLFNPRPNFASAAADVLTAFFNPQMAAWAHSPFAVEAEQYVISELGQKFGYTASEVDGVFTSGGAEANHTALLTALTHHFPSYAKSGLQQLQEKPVFYISKEGHHSFLKAAMNTGIGQNSLRFIEVHDDLSMDMVALRKQIQTDLDSGFTPFMVVATLGTTGVGAIDSLERLKAIKDEFSIWIHADAAYGGGLVLSETFREKLGPTKVADSITIDAHKWMSVPMGAGIFLTRHPDILKTTFSIHTAYMPHDESGAEVVDPYSHSIQWSRRFIGLKVYMSLLVFGWKGYDQAIHHMTLVGQYLRKRLEDSGFIIDNTSPLPIVCFRPNEKMLPHSSIEKLHRLILDDRSTWISLYPIHGHQTLRACITNYSTTNEHIDEFVRRIMELIGGEQGA